MKLIPRNTSAQLILIALLTVGCTFSVSFPAPDMSLEAPLNLDPSPRPSPPIHTLVGFDAVFGGEGDTRLLAQAGAPKSAEPRAKTPEERTPEEKKRVKSAVVLLSVLSGIALSGLLLIIAAISIRGLQRKLAGPTRLDRDPADLFPPPPRSDPDAPPAAGTAAPADASSQETRLT